MGVLSLGLVEVVGTPDGSSEISRSAEPMKRSRYLHFDDHRESDSRVIFTSMIL
jgi:hypothetical protein